MKPATNVDRPLIQLPGFGHLLEQAFAHDGHSIAEGEGFGLVVGDIDGGGPQAVLEAGDLGAHLAPELGVEVGQRLVQQEGLDGAHDGPPHGHPLALTARELAGLAVEVVGDLQVAATS